MVMNLSRSGGSLTFGYNEQMYIYDFMESINDMKAYVKFLEDNDSVYIPSYDEEKKAIFSEDTFEIDLDDTQSFWHNNDGELIMSLSGIAYDTRCYAYFGIVNHNVLILQVCDSSTDRPYFEREET
jgi:hypothetical protein